MRLPVDLDLFGRGHARAAHGARCLRFLALVRKRLIGHLIIICTLPVARPIATATAAATPLGLVSVQRTWSYEFSGASAWIVVHALRSAR